MNSRGEKASSLPVKRIRVLLEDGRARRGWIPCRVGKEIQFSTAGLESYCFSNWEPVIFDVFLLVAAVDFCDRIIRRPSYGWGRQIEVQLPVHEPDRWNGLVSERLVAVLNFLTGDRWHLLFQSRRSKVDTPRQNNFVIPNPSSAVVPYSDGLDSRITSELIKRDRKINLIRVRLGLRKAQSRRRPFAVVPYKVGPGRNRFVENTARSRGFKFTMLSGVAAYLCKAQEIIIPESGQGILGPALVPVGHAYEDYRNHPRFTAKITDLLNALLGHQVSFSFPRLWHTKGETLKEYVELVGETWSDTRSCWQQSRQVSVDGRRRQCGICAACMLRRQSVHASGLVENPKTYIWENLKAKTFEDGAATGFSSFTRALREYAIAGTLHLDHLAALSDSPRNIESIRRAAFQLSPLLGLGTREAEKRLCQLLYRHKLEWGDFVASLGTDSFIANWIQGIENDKH